MRIRTFFSFAKFFLFAVLVVLSDCRKRADSGCAGGEGLASIEWTGASLPALQVSFTFDDVTGDAVQDISNYLRSMNAPSVFFTAGSAGDAHQATLNSISTAGHLVGSLGWSGQDLSAAVDPVMEVRRADILMQSYASGNVFLVRSTGGWNQGVADALKTGGLAKYAGGIGMDIGWKVYGFSDDLSCVARSSSVDVCANGYFEKIQTVQRGIVNFRTSSAYTLSVLRVLLPQLKSAGFTFVRVDSIPDIKAKLVGGAANAGKTGSATCDDYR